MQKSDVQAEKIYGQVEKSSCMWRRNREEVERKVDINWSRILER